MIHGITINKNDDDQHKFTESQAFTAQYMQYSESSKPKVGSSQTFTAQYRQYSEFSKPQVHYDASSSHLRNKITMPGLALHCRDATHFQRQYRQ